MSGAELIAAERRRQIEAEGWTPEHDDEHVHNELAWAAASYAIPEAPGPVHEGETSEFFNAERGVPTTWPTDWEEHWWKPSPGNRVRELTKAGALIAAEIDRLQRVPVCEVLGDREEQEFGGGKSRPSEGSGGEPA